MQGGGNVPLAEWVRLASTQFKTTFINFLHATILSRVQSL